MTTERKPYFIPPVEHLSEKAQELINQRGISPRGAYLVDMIHTATQMDMMLAWLAEKAKLDTPPSMAEEWAHNAAEYIAQLEGQIADVRAASV